MATLAAEGLRRRVSLMLGFVTDIRSTAFGQEVKMEIPTDNSSHRHLATGKTLGIEMER
jgi:hypothetical protein